MSDELKKTILEAYLDHTEKSATTGLYYHVMAKELGLNEDKVVSECKYLEDDRCLEKEKIKIPGDRDLSIGVRITSKGKTALQTIYNPEWVKQNNKEKEDKINLREREIKSVESSLKWIKIGVIAAIAFSLFSLIISVMKS